MSPRTVRVLEHLEVLRDGGLGEGELVDDVAADARLAADEQAEDLDPRRMPDRLREQRQLLVGLVALDGAQVGLIVRRRRRARLGDLLQRSSHIVLLR